MHVNVHIYDTRDTSENVCNTCNTLYQLIFLAWASRMLKPPLDTPLKEELKKRRFTLHCVAMQSFKDRKKAHGPGCSRLEAVSRINTFRKLLT